MEIDDAGIFPPLISPEELFDQAANLVSTSDNIHVIEETHIIEDDEPDIVYPSSAAVLQALSTIELYALGRGDTDVLGGTFDIEWYKELVRNRKASEMKQSKIRLFSASRIARRY